MTGLNGKYNTIFPKTFLLNTSEQTDDSIVKQKKLIKEMEPIILQYEFDLIKRCQECADESSAWLLFNI